MDDTDQLLTAETAVMRAIGARDVTTLNALLASEFILQVPRNHDIRRQEFLDAISAIPGEIQSVLGQHVKARIVGEAGIVTGIQSAIVRLNDGTTTESRTAFTDVFQRGAVGWQLAFAFSVELPNHDELIGPLPPTYQEAVKL